MARAVSAGRWRLGAIALFAVLFAMALATFRSYGVAADEPTQQAYGELIGRFYATAGRDIRCNMSWDWRYYGGLFEGPAAWLAARSPLGVHATRSLLSALAGLAGIAGCWHAALALGGPRTAFLAALVLALIPGWWGQMFINSKDIPFAAACAWALSGTIRIAKLGDAPPWPLAAWTGAAIGAALGVRAGGILHAGYLALVLGAAAIALRRPAWPLCRSFAVSLGVAWAVMLVAWPYALVNPLAGLPKALRYFERFPTPFPVLFEGRLERATSLPREYLPVLLGLTLPEPVLLLLAAGAGLAIAALFRRRRVDPGFTAIGVVVLAAALPVLYAVARRTPMYNGVRHTLFILPPVACLAALTADALLARLRPAGRAVLAALLVVAAARQAVLGARLFPYEYASFNSFAGGLPGAATRFDVEYWGTAITEAARGLAAKAPASPGRHWRIRVCGDWSGAAGVLGPGFEKAPPGGPADFYLGITAAWAGCSAPPAGPVLSEVSRSGVPLAVCVDLREAGDVVK